MFHPNAWKSAFRPATYRTFEWIARANRPANGTGPARFPTGPIRRAAISV